MLINLLADYQPMAYNDLQSIQKKEIRSIYIRTKVGIGHCLHSEEAKAWALLHAIKYAQELNISKVIFWFNCKPLVDNLQAN